VSNQWYWIPDGVNTTPTYAPALVAFIPLDNANQIGWVPLGPGDSYAPRYYDDNWQPHYLSRANVAPAQLVNLAIPDAVTVVPVDAFGRVIDTRSVRIDRQRLASVRSTLDPLTLTPLRNAVIHSAWGRGKISLPPGIAKKLRDTPVYVGSNIKESRFRKDLAKSMRVERVSDKDRNQKFKFRDVEDANARQAALQADQLRKQDEYGRKQEKDRVKAEVTRGNREAERQARNLDQQQKQAARVQAEASRAQERSTRDRARAIREQEQFERKAQQQPQGERVSNPANVQTQRKATRPQANRSRTEGQLQQSPQSQQPKQRQLNKHESQMPATQSHGAAKREGKQGNPAAAGQSQGAGKGKGKGKS
jgi:hypothetical protein